MWPAELGKQVDVPGYGQTRQDPRDASTRIESGVSMKMGANNK
jgi:hypothetical protein